MKIELTQSELVTVVRKYYNLASTVDLEVTVEAAKELDLHALDKATSIQPNDDATDLLEDVRPKRKKSKKHSKRRAYTRPGSAEIPVPKNPKLDYTVYGQAIEDFLKSGQDFMLLPIDVGVKNSGMLYRYRTAAEMFGFRGKIALNAPKHRDELIISLPGKSPQNYLSKPKAHIK